MGEHEHRVGHHQTASVTAGGQVFQAGRDMVVNEVHHHRGPADTVVLVEPVLPPEETVAEVFVGRTTETDDVLAILDPSKDVSAMMVVSAVAGLAGIGKTALARVAAAEAVSRGWFPGGAVFVDLNGYAPNPEDRILPHHAYAPILHILGWDGPVHAGAQAQAAQYHRLLTERARENSPVLIVLDNASTTDQLSGLLPRSHKHRVVVTSRHTLTLRGSRTLDLEILAQGDSIDLMGRQLEVLHPGDARVGRDLEGARRLCDLCGHLPLALHIVTALLAGDGDLSPTELAEHLARAHRKLDLLDDGERAVRAAFELSYLRLSEEQARLFRLLPVNPGPHFGIEPASCLLDVDTSRARLLLRELARAHVIEHSGEARWRQHDLIRDYAIELLQRCADDQEAPAARLLEHYTDEGAAAGKILQAAGHGLTPPRDFVERTLAWFDEEQPNLQAAIAMALTFSDAESALRMLEALVRLHRHRQQTAELTETCRRVVAVARDAEGSVGSGWTLAGLAWTLGATGSGQAERGGNDRLLDYDGNQFRGLTSRRRQGSAAVTLGELLDDTRATVGSLRADCRPAAVPLLHAIARTAAVIRSHHLTGADALDAAADISREAGDARPEVRSRTLHAQELLRLGHTDACVNSLDLALGALPPSVEQESPEWQEACELLASSAIDTLAAVPAHETSSEAYAQRALRVATEASGLLTDPMVRARLTARTGTVHHSAGRHASAVASYQEAATVLEENHRPNELGLVLANLSLAQLALRGDVKAASTAIRAVGVLDKQGDPHSHSQALDLLTYAFIKLGRLDDAITCTNRGGKAAQVAGLMDHHVSASLALVRALHASGRRRDTARVVQQTLRTVRESNDVDLYYRTVNWLTDQGLPAD